VRGTRRPRGWRRGWDIEERLTGLLILAFGCLALLFVTYLLNSPTSIANGPFACLILPVGLGGIGMLAVGLKQVMDP
jgi:hypothetical protein